MNKNYTGNLLRILSFLILFGTVHEAQGAGLVGKTVALSAEAMSKLSKNGVAISAKLAGQLASLGTRELAAVSRAIMESNVIGSQALSKVLNSAVTKSLSATVSALGRAGADIGATTGRFLEGTATVARGGTRSATLPRMSSSIAAKADNLGAQVAIRDTVVNAAAVERSISVRGQAHLTVNRAAVQSGASAARVGEELAAAGAMTVERIAAVEGKAAADVLVVEGRAIPRGLFSGEMGAFTKMNSAIKRDQAAFATKTTISGGKVTSVEMKGITYNITPLGRLERNAQGKVINAEGKVVVGGYQAIKAAYAQAKQVVSLSSGVERITAKANMHAIRRVMNKEMGMGLRIVRSTFNGIKGTVGRIWSLTKTLMFFAAMAIGFCLPNTLLEMEQYKKTKEALRDTVAGIQRFAGLYLQIPPQLVSYADASLSRFVYTEVPKADRAYPMTYFTEQVLRDAKYHVVYTSDFYPWAQTYIGNGSPTGVMVNLNTGWLFTGQGVNSDDTRANFPMRPRGTQQVGNATVENFVNQVASNEGQMTYAHITSVSDYAGMLGFSHPNKTFRAVNDPTIVDLFSTPTAIPDGTGLVGAEFTPPPPIFLRAISRFRSKTRMPYFGNINLREIKGTGFLNKLLTAPKIDWTDPKNSELQTKLNALAQAQNEYDAVFGFATDGVTETYQKNTKAAQAKLIAAQKEVASLLSAKDIEGYSGIHPSEDVNLYNLFVYEVTCDEGDVMTPTLDFLVKNRPNTLIPVADYVVCLNSSGNIVPLHIPYTVPCTYMVPDGKDPETKNKIEGRTVDYIVNPNINYIASLVTGLTYARNATGILGSPLMTTQNNIKVPDTNLASNAFNKLMTQATSVANNYNAVAMTIGISGLLPQIIAMSNYLVKAATGGPFVLSSGYQFDQVPLMDILHKESTESTSNSVTLSQSLSDVLSGLKASAGANIVEVPYATQEAFLQNICIYKVSIPGCNGIPIGALSYKNAEDKIVNIPDYVIPVTLSTDTSSFIIIPLGLNNLTGSPIPANAQFMFSLITGQVYDSNYNLVSPTIVANIPDRTYLTYLPTLGNDVSAAINQVSTSVKTGWPTMPYTITDSSGSPITVQIPYAKAPFATGFMPTAVNPYNIMFVNESDKTAYTANLTALNNAKNAQATASAAVNSILGISPGLAIPSIILDMYNNSQQSGTNFVDTLPAKISGISKSTAQSLASALKTYISATTAFNDVLNAYNTFKVKMDAGIIPTATQPANNQLQIPPLYFVYFSHFSVAADGGVSSLAVPGAAVVGSNMNLTWINTKPSTSSIDLALQTNPPTPVPLANVLPKTFLGCDFKELIANNSTQGNVNPTYYATAGGASQFPSLINTYYQWELSQGKNYWVQNALIGPFNFTTASLTAAGMASQYNVFLTATSRADVANGNFFYFATGFGRSDVFVLARAAQSGGAVSSLSDLQDIGKPFQLPGGSDWYMINLSTGYVYTPNDGETSAKCIYNNPANDPMYNPMWWSLQQAGKNVTANGKVITVPLHLDPTEVLNKVLANTVVNGRAAQMTDLSPSLQTLLTNVMAVGKQLAAKSLYPIYFNNQFTLRLRQDQIDNASYVYGVADKGEAYLDATDYLVSCSLGADSNGYIDALYIMPAPILQGSTSGASLQSTCTLVSLVTGTVYEVGGTYTEILNMFGVDVSEVPEYFIPQIPTLASDVVHSINQLNALYIANKKKLAAQATGLDAPSFDPSMVSTTPVDDNPASPYSILFASVSSPTKYFSKTSSPAIVNRPDASGKLAPTLEDIDIYFDFKATPDWTTDASQIGDYGVSYNVNPLDPSQVIPVQIVYGYALQAMRSHNGIYISPDGSQALGIPIESMALLKADGETSVIPALGQSGQYTKYLSQYGSVEDTNNYATYTYYHNKALNGFFAGVHDHGIPATALDTNFTMKNGVSTISNPDKLVDLLSGDCYDLQGIGYKQPVTMAFVQIVPHSYVQTIPGLKTAALPFAQLQAATAIPGYDNLYKVNGKYYHKSVGYTPVVDMYGNTVNDSTGTQMIEQTVRYLDFNGSQTTATPTKDTGQGIWYQLVTNTSGNITGAVPIDMSVVDDPINADAQYLTNARVYYGVMVGEDGVQTLSTPVTHGVDFKRAYFTWGNDNAFAEEFSMQAYYFDGISYDLYDYVPYSRIYSFISPDNTKMYDYSFVPQQDETSDVAQIQCTTTTIATAKSQTAIITGVTDMAEALQNAIKAGYIMYQIAYELSGSYDNIIAVSESLLTPKTYKIAFDNNEYLQILPDIDYQTAWATTPTTDPDDVQATERIGDRLVKGTPFVANLIGGRAQGSHDRLENMQELPVITGVLDPETGGLLAIVTDEVGADGYLSTQYHIALGLSYPSTKVLPGTLNEMDAATGGFIYGMTSNYPVLSSPSGAPLNQGNYITIQMDSSDEHLYSFMYQSASDNELAAMKTYVNLASQFDLSLTLAGSFKKSSVAGISGVQGGISSTLSMVTSPDKRVLYQVPPVSIAKGYYASDKTTYTNSYSGEEINAYQNYQNLVEIYGIGTYIDYETGIIFGPLPDDQNTLYPIGTSVSAAGLDLIHGQCNNYVVQWNGDFASLVDQRSLVNTAITPTTAAQVTQTQSTPAPTPKATTKAPVIQTVALPRRKSSM